ncbi:HET-domain-containing protein [Mollisia scopiformis]|uniref:HET-domain-containing protein n=1 Tax=Mollisia scopiformis TaxID=149040 RepID=A0A194XVB0_MOLSC|nr:HET-domain-containing protein [Mollisia scopiformis]KUJ23954.1 HET-domain-containing protein [Mollisia scopiformis]
MASASSSSSCQAEGEDVVCKNDIFTFHPFARLPPELRHKIWLEYLTSSGAAPQIFRFKLRWPPRAAYRLKRTDLRAGDQIFLQPSPFGREPNQSLQALRLPIAARQIASATCMESRQAVIDLYPDTLKFRYLPVGWMSDNSMKGVYLGSPDGAGCPEHILRFNGAKDIVILDAAWEDQEAAIEIAESRGSPPDEFLKMCHVGIRVNDFKFRHNWLPSSADRSVIRLLELRLINDGNRVDSPEMIEGSVATYNLRDNPNYNALSYAWGPQDLSAHITLQDEVFLVSQNLFAALRQIYDQRTTGSPLKLWVDAICINQSDNVEKSHQVLLMRDIYSQANIVLAWIGAPDHLSALAFDTLEKFAADDGTTEGSATYRQLPDAAKKRTAIKNFVERGYFVRMWIVQEVVAAKKVTIFCGALSLDYDKMRLAFQRMTGSGFYPFSADTANLSFIGWWRTSFHETNAPDRGELLDLRLFVDSRDRIAADPRDKIYSLQGITNKALGSRIKIDYNDSIETVYIQFAKTVLSIRSDFQILSAVILRHQQISNIKLPSYVPDWSLPNDPQYLQYSPYMNKNMYGTNKIEFPLDENIPEPGIKSKKIALSSFFTKVKDTSMAAGKSAKWVLFDKKKLETTVVAFQKETQKLRGLLPLAQSSQFSKILDNKFAALTATIRDQNADRLGLVPHAKLIELNEADQDSYTDENERKDYVVRTNSQESELHIGMVEYKRQGSKNNDSEAVLIELKHYPPLEDDEDDGPDVETEANVRRLAGLLQISSSGARELRTLPFKYYIHQAKEKRYAFIFGYPLHAEHSQPVSLYELIKNSSANKRFPLATRFRIAHMIAQSIGVFHADGWVHKSVCSQSIVFFNQRNKEGLMLESPYLVDFGYSCPEQGRTYARYHQSTDINSLYLHPDRPKMAFTKLHDIYALGVVLLEIATWTVAQDHFASAAKGLDLSKISINKEEVRERFLAVAGKNIPYQMGTSYMEAVVACLDDTYRGQTASVEFVETFQTEVIENLGANQLL